MILAEINPYFVVIGFSLAIIVSYLFNILAKRTNIPSVLLLIVSGIIVHQAFVFFDVRTLNLFPILEILGIIGLIMIVLEAALDLELKKEKWPIIWKSFSTAFLGLGFCILLIGILIEAFFGFGFKVSVLYAIPLSIISSAIVIPSVVNLDAYKHEFLVYESTFSDILGIMAFYFLLGDMESKGNESFFSAAFFNISITIFISFVASYLLILLFQKIKTKTKLFLLISVLILLYSLAKLMHLSSLLIVLVFGLILNNHKLFFFGKLKKFLDEESIKDKLQSFKLVTLESAFVVRTFFFLLFGMTIELGSLVDLTVFFVSLVIVAIIFGTRLLSLRSILGKNVKTFTSIAPRGLITILLFFSIPKVFQQSEFSSGILLYVIMFSAVVMTIGLIQDSKKKTLPVPEEASKDEVQKMLDEMLGD